MCEAAFNAVVVAGDVTKWTHFEKATVFSANHYLIWKTRKYPQRLGLQMVPLDTNISYNAFFDTSANCVTCERHKSNVSFLPVSTIAECAES